MRMHRNTPEYIIMRRRLIFVALIAFALGAAVDHVARITNYDQVIFKMGQTIKTQKRLIDKLQANGRK